MGREFVCLQAQLERHNKGLVKSTKPGIPWKRVWLEKVKDRGEALILEKRIKGRGAKRYLSDIGYDFSL